MKSCLIKVSSGVKYSFLALPQSVVNMIEGLQCVDLSDTDMIGIRDAVLLTAYDLQLYLEACHVFDSARGPDLASWFVPHDLWSHTFEFEFDCLFAVGTLLCDLQGY